MAQTRSTGGWEPAVPRVIAATLTPHYAAHGNQAVSRRWGDVDHKPRTLRSTILIRVEQAERLVAEVYTARVLDRLLEIQRRAGKDDGALVRALALDAQEDLLEVERQMVTALSELHELKRRLERCEQSRLAASLQPFEVPR